jgi:hypothetical protein
MVQVEGARGAWVHSVRAQEYRADAPVRVRDACELCKKDSVARQDNGTIVSTEGVAEVALPSGWSWLSMVWKAASSGSSNGFIRL